MNGDYNRPPTQYRHPASRSYISLIIIGLIILMTGGIIITGMGFFEAPVQPEYPDYSGSYDAYGNYSYSEAMEEYEEAVNNYEIEYKEYNDNKRIIATVGNQIQYTGVILLAIGLIIGAVKDESLPENTRLGMLIAMGLIVGFKIGGFFYPYLT